MPIVNVTLTLTEKDKDHGKNIARELGINPNEFLSACLVMGINSLNADTYKTATKIMATIKEERINSNAQSFFNPAKPASNKNAGNADPKK